MNKQIILAIIIGLTTISCKQNKTEMKEKIIKANNIELSTESFGNKNNPAILLIAGATVSMLYWDTEFCEKLSEKGFFVIRYDNRDVGQSTNYEPGSTPYDIVDLTNDAISILDGYEIDKAHFVGISLGGLISQIAAIKFPDRVITLTLMSSGPWGDSDPTIPEMDTKILEHHGNAELVEWTNEDSVVNYMVKGFALMSGRKSFDKQRIEKFVRAEFNRAKNYISMFNHATLQGGEHYWNRLNEIHQPTLIIHGTDDKIWHYKNSGVLLEKIQKTKLITLEGTGHELHYDDWETIINGLTKHIND